MSYITTIAVGRLGAAPELRYTDDNAAVCNFPLAVNQRWNDREGNPQEKTTWLRVSVWGNQAEPCSRYLDKGREVLVEGEVEGRAYLSRDGEARASLELRARRVQFLGGRGEGDSLSDVSVEDSEEVPF